MSEIFKRWIPHGGKVREFSYFSDIQATEFDQLYLIKQKMPFGFASERASGKSNTRSCPL